MEQAQAQWAMSFMMLSLTYGFQAVIWAVAFGWVLDKFLRKFLRDIEEGKL
jgi:flagellar biogenesis protein FliO